MAKSYFSWWQMHVWANLSILIMFNSSDYRQLCNKRKLMCLIYYSTYAITILFCLFLKTYNNMYRVNLFLIIGFVSDCNLNYWYVTVVLHARIQLSILKYVSLCFSEMISPEDNAILCFDPLTSFTIYITEAVFLLFFGGGEPWTSGEQLLNVKLPYSILREEYRLRVLENKVMWRIFVSKAEGIMRELRNCITRISQFVFLT